MSRRSGTFRRFDQKKGTPLVEASGGKLFGFGDEGEEIKVIQVALPDHFIEQGSVSKLREENGLDADSIVKRIIVEYIGM